MTDTTNAVPNPGSDQALLKGCLCAVMDNCHGQGVPDGKGGRTFWITLGCPVHAPNPMDAVFAP